MPGIVVVSKEGCSACEQAKLLCSMKGLVYTQRLEGGEWMTAYGLRSYPQIYWDGVHIGGLEELKAKIRQWEKEGKL